MSKDGNHKEFNNSVSETRFQFNNRSINDFKKNNWS